MTARKSVHVPPANQFHTAYRDNASNYSVIQKANRQKVYFISVIRIQNINLKGKRKIWSHK